MTAIALDLGSSNTVAAVLNAGRPSLVPLKGGARAIPSAVALDERGRWLVGRDAKAQLLSRPAQTVVGMKSLMGRDAESTAFKLEVGQLGYRVGDGSDGPAAVLGDRNVSLLDAAGMVLNEVRAQAQDSLGRPIDKAVLPVPEYFTEEQRAAFAEAAHRGGIRKAWIVDETDALVSLLGSRRGGAREEKTVFLYGLGGGFFDAAVLDRAEKGGYEIVAASGEDLGGIKLDRRLAGHLRDVFAREHGLGAYSDPIGLQRLLKAAEAAKIRLDDDDVAPVSLPFLGVGNGGTPLDLACELRREDLVRLTGDLVRQTIAVCRSVLRTARLEPSEVDAVYLYGRSTRAREVLAATSRFFGRVPARLPYDASALGASIMAGP